MKTTARRGDPVRPSSRDPVGGWLDVFIPMLGLPRGRAEEIRAELEDHLRARVDDLVITGKTETEATQQAVSELGETAELARGFRTALKPRRRIIVQTVLMTTVVGVAVTFGILGVQSPGGTGAEAAPAAGGVVSPPVLSEVAPQDNSLRRYDLSVFAESVGETVEESRMGRSIMESIYALFGWDLGPGRSWSALRAAADDSPFVLRIVGNTMYVRCNEQDHNSIAWLLGNMRSDIEKRREAERKHRSVLEREREEEIRELVAEMGALKADIVELSVRVEQLEIQREHAMEQLSAAQMTLINMQRIGGEKLAQMKPDDPLCRMSVADLKELIERNRLESSEFSAELTPVRIELKDKRAYRDAIRGRLIGLKYPPVLHAAQDNRRKGGGLKLQKPAGGNAEDGG